MGKKTTVELREPLLEKARKAAADEGTSLRASIEEGLELALKKRQEIPWPCIHEFPRS